MRYLLTLLSLTLAALPASAETIRVRSGDHGDFTRVVLEFDRRPDWRAGRIDGGYGIELPGEEPIVADLSRAFRMIGRDRLRDVKIDAPQSRVEFALACDCFAEIFAFGSQAIVIDIRDGQPDQRARHEALLDEAPEALSFVTALVEAPSEPPLVRIEEIAHIRPAGLSAVPVLQVPGPLPSASIPDERFRPRDGMEFDKGRGTDIGLVGLNMLAADGGAIDDVAVAALSEQLARAISQGLIDPVESGSIVRSDGEEATSGSPRRNFMVQTGFDRDLMVSSGQVASTSLGSRCITEQLLGLGEWGDPKQARDLGRLRGAAIAEDGALTDTGARDLARYYIVLGFGSEAAMLARRLPPGTERELLLAMAEVIDRGQSPAPILDGQLQCNGEVALWAALARPFEASEAPRETETILAAFSGLPYHLRLHLGPILSERLRAAGQTSAARMALNAVTRAGTGSIQQDLTAARLGLTGTNASEARNELERLSHGTDMASAEALLELLLDAERRGVPPKPAWIDDAPSLIRATKGTELSKALSLAALRGHIPLGRFDALRLRLITEQPGVTEQTRGEISILALSAAVMDADDETFLRTELAFSPDAPPRLLEPGVALTVAERLAGLGLPFKALEYLPESPANLEESALAALMHSETRALEQAWEVLATHPDGDLAMVRGDVLLQQGNLMAAQEAFLEAGSPLRASQTAMRAGEWQWLASHGAEGLHDAVAVLIAPAPEVSDIGAPGNAALAEGAARRRAAIAALLKSPVIDPDS